MKIYFILLIILACVACKEKQRWDNIVMKHNFSVPEQLSFQLQSQILLTDSVFNADIPDRSIMQRLDSETTVQILQLCDKVYDYDDICDTIPLAYYENTNCYIYGKIDLQPSVESIVVWELAEYPDINNNMRTLWLLNLKDDKLYSVILLNYSPDSWTDMPPLISTTYYKNKCFTQRAESTNDDSSWKNFKSWLYGGTNHISYYSHYIINKDGFVEFIEK